MTIKTKTCSKCNISKPLSEFYKDKNTKSGVYPSCKKCVSQSRKKYYRKHPEEVKEQQKKYYENHKKERSEYRKKYHEEIGREKAGQQSMYENKTCSSYLGVVIAERLCHLLFKNVEVMPNGNSGYDFICNKNKKIDVKSGCVMLDRGKNPRWIFYVDHNKVADYFICVAFDNRTDLNPLHLWMIPGHEINNQTKTSIALSRIHKWDKWKRSINEVQLCCDKLRNP